MQRKSGNPPAKRKARISLPLQPPPGSPFAGISKTNAPARNTKIPNLTEHVAVAKARVTALKDAGLVPEAKREAAAQAQRIIDAQTRTPTHTSGVGAQRVPSKNAKTRQSPSNRSIQRQSTTLPAWLTAPAVSLDAAPPKRTPAAQLPQGSSSRSRGAPPTTARGYTPPTRVQGAGFSGLTNPLTSAVSSIAHDPLKSVLSLAAGPVGAAQIAVDPNKVNFSQEAAKAGLKGASKIQRAGENVASIKIGLLTPAQAANFPGQKSVTEQQIRELEQEKGGLGGLSKAARHTLIEGSVKNGWPRQDVIKLVDSDLINAYGNKPANPVIQFVKNAGSFAASQAAGPAGFVAIGDAAVQAAKGNTTPIKKIGQQFVEGTVNTLPGVGDRPFSQNLYWHPGETVQNFLLGAGTADRILGRAGKFAAVPREILPEGFKAPVSRGTLSERPIQRGIEKTRDAFVRSQNPALNLQIKEHPVLGPFSPVSRRKAIAREAYAQTRERSVAPTIAHSNQLRANVMQAANKVGKERAAALNAYLQGADPATRAAFYRQVSAELGLIKGRGAAAHAKLSEKHTVTEATLTPADREYVDAARAAAEFSTQTRADLGQLSQDLSGRYRAYQAPIVMAAKSGDELATRTQFLHDEWTKGLAKQLPPEELATIGDQFSNALDDFTQRHADLGGTKPVYIPQEIPQTITSKFTRPSSVTANPNVPNLKATQDKLISSGQYRSTPQGISQETHRAAVIRARVDHFNAVNEEYARDAVNGAPHDPDTVVVKADNLRSPVKLANTVDEHNLTDEGVHSTLEQMRLALEGGKVDIPVGGYIPATGHYKVLPKTIYDELHASTVIPKGAPIGQAYDVANTAFKRFMLSKPSTAVSNIGGNPILATMGGASPLDIWRGYDIMRNRPETLPPQLMSGGLAGQMGQKVASTPIGKYINFSLSHQRASEDAARAALYHHNVGPYVRQQVKETGRSADDILKDLASGKDPNVTKFVKKVEDFLSTMRESRKRSPQTEHFLTRSILFHRWLGHILTLTLYTMPVKYPGRAVFLQRVSEIGDDYRKHHGVFPSWYLSMIPLMQHIADNAGVPGGFTRVLPTGALWPTANMPLPLADSEGGNPWAAVIGSAQPVVRAALEAPTGMNWSTLRPYKDAQGQDIGPGLNTDLFLGQQYRNLPYASYVTPMPGRGDTAYPTNMTNRVKKNKYGKPLPEGFGTSAIPYGGNTPSLTPQYGIGLLSRMLLGGSGVQDLPTHTRGTNYARTAQLVTARKGHNKIVREQARARARRKG